MREDREKIKKMLLEGKINSDEAKLLLRALNESEKKKERIFKEILDYKKKREKKIWIILGGWVLILLLIITPFFIYSIGTKDFSLKISSSTLDYFQRANFYLQQEDYRKAIEFCKKGIEESPQFSLGYSLLGASYQLLYKETNNEIFKNKAKEVFEKAERIKKEIPKRRQEMKMGLLFMSILLIVVLSFLSILLLLFYNLLVRREEKANKSFADIQAQYQKKLDLVPVLLEAVKNYAAHEKETQLQVTQARSKVQEVMEGFLAFGKEKLKKFLESQKELNTGLVRLFALAEKYPDLKASANFLTIQKQLEDIENTIARKREIYNNQVRVYNSSLRYFPMNLIVKVFKFEPKEYFEMEKV